MPTKGPLSNTIYDAAILERLDGEWRSIVQIRLLLGFGDAIGIAAALERLAKAGLIEKIERDTGIRRSRTKGRELVVRQYRGRTSVN